MKTLQIYTDGGSKGNPGPAAIGMAFFIDGRQVFSHRADIGAATNNDAEYQAVITALNKVKEFREWESVGAIGFYSDSQLLVNQLNGLYKVKNAKIRAYIIQIKQLEQEIKLPVSYHHIPREENQLADDLVNNRIKS
ncbi:ribonuclease HI family protein [Patescibacteria group bacterium]|nr:ribonuclease HI family protein [Patescibacteria group bacterium]MCL5091510.1 ribonuclease HI family protein [Patescibacteria group bacterium]